MPNIPDKLAPGDYSVNFQHGYSNKKFGPLVKKVLAINAANKGSLTSEESAKNFLRICGFIEKHCGDALKAMRETKRLLYRGVRADQSHNELYFMGYPRTDRNPKDTSPENQSQVDKYLTAMGFKAIRSNSIFTNSCHHTANIYGPLYAIFPMDGFSYTWSLIHMDWTIKRYSFHKNYFQAINLIIDRFLEIEPSLNWGRGATNSRLKGLFLDFKAVSRNIKYASEKGITLINALAITRDPEFIETFTPAELEQCMYAFEQGTNPTNAAEDFVKNNKLLNNKWFNTALSIEHEILINGQYVAIRVDPISISLLEWYFLKRSTPSSQVAPASLLAIDVTYPNKWWVNRSDEELKKVVEIIVKYSVDDKNQPSRFSQWWSYLQYRNVPNNPLRDYLYFTNSEAYDKVIKIIEQTGGTVMDVTDAQKG